VRFPVRLTTKQDQTFPIHVGTVQWFSNSKGYGFIRGQDGVERFFHVTDLAGGFIPDRGASVFFQSRQDGKGPRAVGVVLNPTYGCNKPFRRDGRGSCPHCSRPIVPRMTFWYGRPYKSYCTFCGGVIQDFYEYKPSTLDIIWDVVIHIFAFFYYFWTFVVGLYFLTEDNIELWQLILGTALVSPTTIKVFNGIYRLVSGIATGIQKLRSILVDTKPNKVWLE